MTTKDVINRDTLKRIITDSAYYLLGLDVQTIELLETQNQQIEDCRAD